MEFDLDKSWLHQYAIDYMVAMGAAAIPWLFTAGMIPLKMLLTGLVPKLLLLDGCHSPNTCTTQECCNEPR